MSTSALYTDVSVTADYSPEAVEGDGWQVAASAVNGNVSVRLGAYRPPEERWWPEGKGEEVFVNGEAQDEPYVVHDRANERLEGDDLGPLTVPAGSFFVLGPVGTWFYAIRSGVRGGAPSVPSELRSGFSDPQVFRAAVGRKVNLIEERGYTGVWNGR